jgi:hypothetical protein
MVHQQTTTCRYRLLFGFDHFPSYLYSQRSAWVNPALREQHHWTCGCHGARRGTFEAVVCWLIDSSGETVMTKFGTISAACLAAALAIASPAFARSGHGAGGHGSSFRGGSAHFAGGGGFRRGGGGYGPGIAAGLIAGAAIGSSGYYGPGHYDDSYAYDNGYNGASDNGYNGGYDNGYAVRNGFVCQPGTVFRGEDGRPHLCQ